MFGKCCNMFLGVLLLSLAGSATAQTWTIFTDQVPAADAGDRDMSYELGTRFMSKVGAQLVRVRIYASASEEGEHTVRLWRAEDSTLVAGPYSWSFPAGTEGWKEFSLPEPVTIEGNTDYIVAVTNGSDQWYFCTLNAFDAPINNGPLVTYRGSGLFATTLGTMPNQVWNNSNYYRDVVIETLSIASGPKPANGAMDVLAPLLQWSAGDGARFHDVYFGTDPNLGPEYLVGSHLFWAMHYIPQVLVPGTTYYWRVDEIEADGTVHTGNVWSFMTQDLEAYHPDPADGATDVWPDPSLLWLPGQAAMTHHVYFSDSREAVSQAAADADKGEFEDPIFAPGDLATLTTYYWRVDEVVAGSEAPRTGPVWSFTTCLPIDDFESYTDDVGQRIFQTWIDGFGYTEPTVVPGNGTGATVGYTQPPFAEQKIVHGGLQSMPLDYNNVNSPFYSEAVRDFAPAQDWTANDANGLVLYVRGLVTNAPAPLYVAIEDASKRIGVVVHADPEVVTRSRWIKWEIPFRVFTEAGVDLSRVKTMRIGVGDKMDSTSKGTGRIYVDDICQVRSSPDESQ